MNKQEIEQGVWDIKDNSPFNVDFELPKNKFYTHTTP